jgi:hypothetical protein
MRKKYMSKSGWTIFPSLNVRTIMESSGASFQESFTAKADRTSWIYI